MRKWELDIKDFKIFNCLYQNPFATYSELSKDTGLSPTAVKERINRMKNSDLIKSDTVINDEVFLAERVVTEVEVRYKPQKIGLTRQHVIFQNINSAHSFELLKKFCDEHPYTHFRSDIYGHGLALYTQFDIPEDINNLMSTVYETLSQKLGINYTMLTETNSTEGTPNLLKFDPLNGGWKSERRIKSIIEHEFNKASENEISSNGVQVYNMSNLDAKLLREMTINGKVAITNLAKYHGVNKSTISRRVKNLKDNVIDGGMLLYDREVFGMNAFSTIIGKFTDEKSMNKVANFIKSKSLPITIRMARDNMLNFNIYLVGSSIHSIDFKRVLWTLSEPSSFYSYQMDTANFMSYYFYHKNYDEREKWNISEEYVLDQPLNILN